MGKTNWWYTGGMDETHLLRCAGCGTPAILIANYCVKCEPALHSMWKLARATVNIEDEATPEMIDAWIELQRMRQCRCVVVER